MRVFVLLVLLVATAPTLAQSTVLSGTPTSVVSSSSAETTREVLAKGKAAESRVVITKNGTDYFWASRGNRPLVRHASGVVNIFVEPGGAGYIEVIDQKDLPEQLRDKNQPRVQYKEHIRSMLTTITYWGTSDAFAP